jgi:hypothetical protein
MLIPSKRKTFNSARPIATLSLVLIDEMIFDLTLKWTSRPRPPANPTQTTRPSHSSSFVIRKFLPKYHWSMVRGCRPISLIDSKASGQSHRCLFFSSLGINSNQTNMHRLCPPLLSLHQVPVLCLSVRGATTLWCRDNQKEPRLCAATTQFKSEDIPSAVSVCILRPSPRQESVLPSSLQSLMGRRLNIW